MTARRRTNGNAAWAVGIEKVQLLRKNGDTLSFDAFVTNVFENRDGRWLVVSHQAKLASHVDCPAVRPGVEMEVEYHTLFGRTNLHDLKAVPELYDLMRHE